jgi:hypothetical protein
MGIRLYRRVPRPMCHSGRVSRIHIKLHELQSGCDVLTGDVGVIFQHRLNGVPAVKSPARRIACPLVKPPWPSVDRDRPVPGRWPLAWAGRGRAVGARWGRSKPIPLTRPDLQCQLALHASNSDGLTRYRAKFPSWMPARVSSAAAATKGLRSVSMMDSSAHGRRRATASPQRHP